MKRTRFTWLLGALLALTTTAWAQDPSPSPPPAGEGETTTSMTTMSGHGTVTREEVRTWTIDVDEREWEVHPATPTYEGTTGLFRLPSAYTLPKGKFSFQLFRDNYDRDPKDVDFSIHGLSIGVGLTNRVELFGNFGLQNRIDTDALFQPGAPNDLPFVSIPWVTGTGDIKLGLKFKLLDDYMNDDPLGLALRFLVKLPTADEGDGLGTGKMSWGGDFILSKGLGSGAADIHGFLGYRANGDPEDPVPVDLGNEIKFGAGINIPACSRFQIQAEIIKTIYNGEDEDIPAGGMAIGEQTNPLDVVIGPVFWFRPGIFIRPAISWNLNFDERGLDQSSASWTGRHISIGYHPGIPCREVVVPPPPPPPPSNANPSVTCEIERSEILPGERVGVRAVASDPDGDTLTYEWSATAGSIVGTGPSVTFDSTGMTPPASATITVRVSDGRGGSAESTCPVRMGAPEARAAEAIVCVSGGFPRNLARLNNVDKACLDDVASRLRQDPRSRVIIVGHADSGERNPEVIARQRAEAAKAYLVNERGVEEARITTRSAAATKPLDTGTDAAARARNRRVEVIFVPEGATVPED
jgi:outer membrane protein OmpA-like peptidoglycan-associated protein